MKLKLIIIQILLLPLFSGCSDSCYMDPLNVNELEELFLLLAEDKQLDSFFMQKGYSVDFAPNSKIKTFEGKEIELLENPMYELSLSNDMECNGKFQMLRINRNNEESPVGKSLVFVYNSSKEFNKQREAIIDLENFDVGMGAANGTYLKDRTGINFTQSRNLQVKQLFTLRRFQEGKDRIQIETFWSEFRDDPDKTTYYIVIRVYPENERWSY